MSLPGLKIKRVNVLNNIHGSSRFLKKLDNLIPLDNGLSARALGGQS